MCKPHWNQYTAGLTRDAKARKAAEAEPVAPEPESIATKPAPVKGNAKEPVVATTDGGSA